MRQSPVYRTAWDSDGTGGSEWACHGAAYRSAHIEGLVFQVRVAHSTDAHAGRPPGQYRKRAVRIGVRRNWDWTTPKLGGATGDQGRHPGACMPGLSFGIVSGTEPRDACRVWIKGP